MASLEQLRKQRDVLLNQSRGNTVMASRRREEDLERRRLMAEINALKNPRATQAKKSFINAMRSTGSFIKQRAKIFNENINRMQEAERKKEMREQSRKVNKPKRRR